MTHHLVGVAEIAEMLGVSRQRVNAIVTTHDSFPKPEAELSAGRIWLRSDIDTWVHRDNRVPPTPDPTLMNKVDELVKVWRSSRESAVYQRQALKKLWPHLYQRLNALETADTVRRGA